MLELYLDNTKVDIDLNFKINMTYQSVDLQQPEAKINNYSKTVTLRGTNNNNNIFGHIFRFDTNILSGDKLVGVSFDPNKRIPFVILDNGDLYESGYAHLDNISIQNNIINYSLTLYGIMGSFFYNLKYNEDGTEKTLYDMYYGIIDLENTKLDKNSENNNILFELDKDFTKKCWDIMLSKSERLSHFTKRYDEYSDTDIRKLICPIPCYQGYYENFDSDIVLVNTTGIHSDSVVKNPITSEDKTYDPQSNWTKVKLDRNVSNFEINDIRSHYLPYGIRLQAIYDALKNPENNGGFEIDDNNVNDIEKKYIYEGYIMQDPFEWEDINANNINTTIKPVWNSMDVNLANRIIHTEKIDVSNYINPNGTFYVMPRITFGIDIGQLRTQALIFGGFYHSFDYGSDGFGMWRNTVDRRANHWGGDSIQYFWAEGLDNNGNVIVRSDVYMYGDKPFDESNNPFYLTNIYGQLETPAGILQFPGYSAGETGASMQAIKYFLDRNGLKIKESLLSEYEKQKWQGYYINDNNLGISINRSHLEDGYKTNNQLTGEYVGEEFKINLKLLKNVKSVRIVTDSIITTWSANNIDESVRYGFPTVLNGFWPVDPNLDINSKTFIISPGFASFTTFIENVEWTMPDRETYAYTHTRFADTALVNWDKISGMISSNTQIYDGAVETLDERHTVNKFTLFQNTSSPYDYLISLAKMFNWRLEHNPITNKINIYSINKYYNNNIIDATNFIDFSNISIVPTTATTNNYTLELELEESYPANNWLRVNKVDYGKTNIFTKYEFGDEPNNILEDCIFKTAVPYTQTSVFFNNDSNYWPRPSLGKYAEVSMWYWQDSGNEKTEKRFGRLHDTANKISQNIQDVSPRLGFFDKEYKSISMNNTLVFFNENNTVDIGTKNFQLSDNIPVTLQLNGNNCYIYLISPMNVTTDIDNGVVDNPIIFDTVIPCFNTHFKYDNIEYWGTMKSEPIENNKTYDNYTDLYNLCWKNYVTDLYNKNNKVVTVKMHLNTLPREAMKQFYTFKNAIWVINKITDYNTDDYMTKVEFIQVQNKNNYLGIK